MNNPQYVHKWIPKDIAYYMHLDNPSVVKKLQNRFKDKAIIYGIRCQVDNMLYIGSTLTPSLRFHKHLVLGSRSNASLQAAIAKHGIARFTVHIFEIVDLPLQVSYQKRKSLLVKVEQQYIDSVPKRKLYNSINASS